MALNQELSAVGLSEKWSTILKNHLGVETSQGLKYIGLESYPLLVQFVSDPHEKIALRKLLQMEEKPVKRNIRILNKQSVLKNLLERLKQLRDSGKHRQDDEVKALEIHCREILQVSENEWIGKEAVIDDMIIKLEELIESIKNHCEGENLHEVEFLAKVPGSLSINLSSAVLKGVRIIDELKNYIFRSSNMLMVPNDIKFYPPLRPQFTEIKQFRSREEEEDFFKQIAMCGCSPPTQDKKTSSTTISEAYLSTVRYWFVPMASCVFDSHQLFLSDDALSHLSNVHQTLANGKEEKEIEKECEGFFERFGSHCLKGPFHFGGLYICKCFSNGFAKFDKLEEIQRLQIEAINAQMCMCFPQCYEETGLSCVKGISGQARLKKFSKLQVVTVGGPEVAIGFPDWKNGLSGSNKMWKMIDSGKSHVAVWDIILNNHKQLFLHAEPFALALKTYWKRCMSKSASNNLQERFMNFTRNLKLETSPDTNLNMILIKRREVEKQIRDPQAWALHFLPHIKDYLCSVMRTCSSADFKKMMPLFKLIVEPLDLEIAELSNSELIKVYDTEKYPPSLLLSDLEYFCRFLRLALHKMSAAPNTFHPYLAAEGVTIIEETVLLLRQYLSKTGQIYEECLLLTILHPCGYIPEIEKFMATVSRKDVEILIDNFKVWSHDFYMLETQIQKQSYLMYLTVHATHALGGREDCISSHVQFLRKQLKLLPEIDSLITSDCNWDVLKNKMKHIFQSMVSVQHSLSQNVSVQSNAVQQQSSATGALPQHPLTDKPNQQRFTGKQNPTPSVRPNSQQHLFTGHHNPPIGQQQLLTGQQSPGPPMGPNGQFTGQQSLAHLMGPNGQFTGQQSPAPPMGPNGCLFTGQQSPAPPMGPNGRLQQQTLTGRQPAPSVRPNSRQQSPVRLNNSQQHLFTGKQTSTVQWNTQTCNALLEKVGLLDYFPQKLSLRDAIQIREDTINMSKSATSSIYPFAMLQKIMAFDSKCRIQLDEGSSTLPSYPVDDSDSNSDESTQNEGIHPMDGLLALLYCSDNFLRQDLFCRLATCQIAVPLLLPHPHTRDPTLLMWALRSIVKEFRCDGKRYNTRIITHPTQFVSFLRFGCHEMSKSETLNGVINKADSHNKNMAFFGFNSPGGANHKVLVNGLVEISWYLPGDGLYSKPIAFTNLRGDACDPELQKQVNFLCDVSAVHVLMLSHDALEDATRDSAIALLQKLSQAPGGLIVLQTETKKKIYGQILECVGEDLFKLKVNIVKNEHSTTLFLDNLKEKLRSKLESNPKHVSPTFIAHKCNIAVDEDNIDCVKGKQLMEELYAVIDKHQANHPNTTPRDLLPLQRLWHGWAELDKEQYRQKRKYQHETRKEDHKQHQGKSTLEYGAEQRKKMGKVRQLQYSLATQRNELMSSFLKTLRTERGFVLRYYLMWLKFKLDDLSRDILPPLYVKICEKREQLWYNKHAESKCQKQLKELECQLINASFGIEHLFREVCQIYESTMAMKHLNRHNISNLPEIAAQLLCDGQPLELLDGDASHIPQKWITAVFNCLADTLKRMHGFNPLIYILSVLGIQSTGKSTLLNTVFGVQFSVSAGRCTRGAFMQLIPVHPSLHKRAGVEYFLLIDTEGLRAPELERLEGREHDNELATFVIGMANLTLINVAGEVSGDMEDILHIVVHAFLRMDQVQLRPSCHVIHQNVLDVMSSRPDEKIMGFLKTKNILDEVTKSAAKEMGVETQYTHFTDVIKFDHDKDVSFFPGLWNEQPPMARVSSFYSKKAQQLKVCVIADCKTNTKYSVPNIRAHLERLWKAILQEDFVFTFQNTFEIVAFKTLEKKYGDLSWGFKSEMSEWEREAQTKLIACDTQERLDDVNTQLMDELQSLVEKKHVKYEEKMLKYCKESNNEIMLKWKPDMQPRLQYLREKLERHAEEHCSLVYQAMRDHAEV